MHLFLRILFLSVLFSSFTKAQVSRIETMAELGHSYRFTDTIKSKKILTDALTLAKESRSKKDEVICLTLLAFTYRRLHQVKKFSYYAEQAYKIALQTHDNRARAYGYWAISDFRSYINDKAGALNYRLKAYTLFEKLKAYSQCGKIASDISYLFSPGSDLKIKKYAYEALRYAEKSSDAESILTARLAVGSYLTQVTDKNRNNSKLWKNAVGFLQKTAEFATREHLRIPSKSNIGIAHINLAALYMQQPKLMDEKSFLTELDSAVAISKQYGIKNVYRNSIGLRAQYFMLSGEYDKTESLLFDGIVYQQSLPYTDHEILASFYSTLKDVAAAKKDYSSYYNYDRMFSKYNSMNYDEDLQKNLQTAEIKFESEKNILRIRQLENERKLQEKNKYLMYAISVILFLISVSVYISFYYRKRYYQNQAEHLKQEQVNNELKLSLLEKDSMENLLAKLSMERRFLQSQMDPHFIFNALGNIQSMILQGDKAKAVMYLNKFSKLTRQILDHSRKESITLEDETENLRNYIELQQLRLNNSFDYEFSFGEQICMQDKIPPLLIQPLVENAIEHGLKPLTDRKGKLIMNFEKKPLENTIVCTIQDNGIGIEASKKNQKNRTHQPLATTITDERLALYSGKESMLIISDLKKESSENGCSVIIHIPLL
ncbi:histidine kinase [Chryseobacterium sp. SSA4.19]|uniref:sensor histidine kinase n=1 Tax=Chryseobacterium sp. SSA4.19 TaxID=2919915 RepID=UPI001F4D60C7|nr:histidine kinase [Chryseobacterium sp. SSA4.19]MCJ8154409.1 histidine kinase [Chryseobacterium sp. SSA4.19]